MFARLARNLTRSISVTSHNGKTIIKAPKSCVNAFKSINLPSAKSLHTQFFHKFSTENTGKVETPKKAEVENTATEEPIKTSPVENTTVDKVPKASPVENTTNVKPATNSMGYTLIETESEIDDQGNELIVVYEVEDELITYFRKEMKNCVINLCLGLPTIVGSFFINSAIAYVMAAIAGLLCIRATLRLASLATTPTKITLAWPVEKIEDVANNMQETLHMESAREPIEPIMDDVAYKSEFQQMQEHIDSVGPNDRVSLLKKMGAVRDQAFIDSAKSMSRGFVENPLFPSLFFEKINFREVVEAWRSLKDPDFPQIVFIDRLGFGSRVDQQIQTRVPITEICSLWFKKSTPDVIPMVSKRFVEACQLHPFDSVRLGLIAGNTGTTVYPKYVKNIDAFNQLVFAANINARKRVILTLDAARK